MGCVQNRGVITQPNFHLSPDVQKTTKAMFKILSLGTFFSPKNYWVVSSHLMPANMHQKCCCLILYFPCGHITGRVYPEYTHNRSAWPAAKLEHISIAYAVHPTSLLIYFYINLRKRVGNRPRLYLLNRVLCSIIKFWHLINKCNITAHETPNDTLKNVHTSYPQSFLLKETYSGNYHTTSSIVTSTFIYKPK